LSLPHFFLALCVVFVWGTNFVVIRWGLEGMPPFAFATLRFVFSALPWLFFIKRPPVAWSKLAVYGLLLGTGQFGLLYLAIGNAGHSLISPGLASLVIQCQVFFTIGLSMIFMREQLRKYQWVALALGVTGIVVIGSHVDATVTVAGLSLILFAAFFWACANLVARSAGKVNMLAFMVWSSVFAIPPLLLISLALEGWNTVSYSITHMSSTVFACVLWQALGNTLFGYAAWNWLLSRYSAAAVTPTALLVPVFGMSASAFVLSEPLQAWKLLAALLVISGLAINVLWPKFKSTKFFQNMSA
jgi:O-acetylserine/cysteine efflux transporter